MNKLLVSVSLLVSASLPAAFSAGDAVAQGQAKSHAHAHPAAAAAAAAPATDEAMVASAMTAAPEAVARNATVIAVGKDGAVRTVRKGTGAFTCMADNPATPGPDPMCMDANALEWASAWMKRQTPPQKTGFMYMLAGGTDASNTDPHAAAPTAGNHWISTGPHVMVVGAPEMLKHYPTAADPDTSQPYVMWAGTPYAHLMIPVR